MCLTEPPQNNIDKTWNTSEKAQAFRVPQQQQQQHNTSHAPHQSFPISTHTQNNTKHATKLRKTSALRGRPQMAGVSTRGWYRAGNKGGDEHKKTSTYVARARLGLSCEEGVDCLPLVPKLVLVACGGQTEKRTNQSAERRRPASHNHTCTSYVDSQGNKDGFQKANIAVCDHVTSSGVACNAIYPNERTGNTPRTSLRFRGGSM